MIPCTTAGMGFAAVVGVVVADVDVVVVGIVRGGNVNPDADARG
jgi:hypothetical protein